MAVSGMLTFDMHRRRCCEGIVVLTSQLHANSKRSAAACTCGHGVWFERQPVSTAETDKSFHVGPWIQLAELSCSYMGTYNWFPFSNTDQHAPHERLRFFFGKHHAPSMASLGSRHDVSGLFAFSVSCKLRRSGILNSGYF